MLDSARLHRILGLALPVIGGMISQNVLNLVDSAMVSRVGDNDIALAAVGIGGFALFATQSILLGLSTGVQASASRRKGEGRESETALFLNAALLIVAICAPLLAITMFFMVPDIFPYLNADPAVIALGVPYMQIRLAGIVFVGMNFSFRGYWNAIDMTRMYLTTLLIMHAINIALNYVLIFGHFGFPELGVRGAAIASVISLGVGTGIYFTFGWYHVRGFGFMKGLPTFADIRKLVEISLPSGLQQLFFSAGFLALFYVIGRVGTTELAAANVLINIMLVAILPGMGLGLAAATLVGQAMGRGDLDDASQWAWDVVKVAAIGMTCLGLPMVLIPETILLLIYELDEETLAATLMPMRIVGIGMAIEALAMVMMQALQGAGDTRRVMLVGVTGQWFLMLPSAFLIGPVLGFGLTGIWLVQSVVRALQAVVFVRLWRGRAWARIAI